MSGPEVVLEVASRNGTWCRSGSVSIDEPPGSLCDFTAGSREILVFGWYEGEHGVWRSVAGVDTENTAVRMITSVEFKLLSDLGEPYVMVLAATPDSPWMTIRFRMLEAS